MLDNKHLSSPIHDTMTITHQPPLVLEGARILSLSLNLPGPAALLRLRQMGAACVKFEPPAPARAASEVTGDPMSAYSRAAYDALHKGIRVEAVDLKTEVGQKILQRALAKSDVLLTSFRPSALKKLGLDWANLHRNHPTLSLVAIVGSPGADADSPGHDLTYLAENQLITGLDLPATLYADMAGALMAVEASLQAILLQRQTKLGHRFEVALSKAAGHLALPRSWGLTLPGSSLGGGHAGYQLYTCLDGRVAMAALEPHFAKSLCAAAGLTWTTPAMMMTASTREAIAGFVARHSCKALEELARQHDIPLHTLPS